VEAIKSLDDTLVQLAVSHVSLLLKIPTNQYIFSMGFLKLYYTLKTESVTKCTKCYLYKTDEIKIYVICVFMQKHCLSTALL